MPTASTAREFQKPVLLVAAESIVLASGMKETIADVLRARAVDMLTFSVCVFCRAATVHVLRNYSPAFSAARTWRSLMARALSLKRP